MKIKTLTLSLLALSLFSCKSKEVKWDATGTFESTEVIVSAEGNGKLIYFNATEGQQLQKDSIIGLIDTTQLVLQKMQLLASNESALSQRADIAKQVAATEQQISFQKSEKIRFENLVALNSATQKQVDDIVNNIAVLEKQLVAQHSTLEKTNTSLIEQSVAFGQQIAQVEDNIHKSLVVSPIDGTLLVKYAEAGEFATIGKPLFSVADMNNIFLRAYITADMLTKMKLGQQVKIYADFGKDQQREYAGTVTWIADKAEFTPKNIQTRDERANMVYAVKIAVANDGYLKNGMYGQMKL